MSVKRLRKGLKQVAQGKGALQVRASSALSSRVEKSVTPDPAPAADGLDPNVLQYVDEFLKSYSNIPPLEPTSLLTKEDAQKAVVVLTEAQERVQAHLRTARALKQMLEAKKAQGGDLN